MLCPVGGKHQGGGAQNSYSDVATKAGMSSIESGLAACDIKAIFPRWNAFAALCNNGSVITWPERIPADTQARLQRHGVKSIWSVSSAPYGRQNSHFIAVCSDYTIVAWGGGQSSTPSMWHVGTDCSHGFAECRQRHRAKANWLPCEGHCQHQWSACSTV